MLDRNSPNSPSHVIKPGYQSHVTGTYGPWQDENRYGLDDEGTGHGFGPVDIIRYLFKYRWLVAIAVVLGVMAGFVVTWMQTPQYQASVKIEVTPPSAKVFQDLEVVSQSADARSLFTEMEKLKTRALAQRVVFALGLADNPDFLFPAPHFALSNLFARAFGRDLDHNIRNYSPERREAIAVNRVRGNISVRRIGATNILSISYRNQNRELSSQVANQIAESFINERIDQTSETSDLARQFVVEQVAQVKDQLQTSERALVEYAKQEGVTLTGDETSLIASQIAQINTALSQAIQERLNYSRLARQIEAGRGASLPQVLESDGIQKLNENLANLSAEYRQKLAMFKPGFPEMQQLQARITELRSQIEGATEVVTTSILLKEREAIEKEADLRSKLTELEAEQVAFQDKNIEYTILKREVDSNRSHYDSLIGKLNQIGVGSELKQRNAVIIDAAAPPGGPFAPRLSSNMTQSLLFFIIAVAAIIYLLELLHNTFSSPDQLETSLKVLVLGVVPKASENEIADQLSDPKSALSEAYRSLRTSLQFTGVDGCPRSILVTSSGPAEGKSTTAFKLARDFGAVGMQVLLIDADLRKPSMHYFFGTDNLIGLSNLLTNTARREDWKRLFRRTRFSNLTLLTAGTIPPNPAELLSSAKMTMLYQACIARYDVVIIDGPPVMGLSDAPILTRLVEGALFVVSANQIPRNTAVTALKRLRMVGGQVFGAAFSKFVPKTFEYNNYNYRYMAEQSVYGDNQIELTDGTRDRKQVVSKNIVETILVRMRRAGHILRGRLDGI